MTLTAEVKQRLADDFVYCINDRYFISRKFVAGFKRARFTRKEFVEYLYTAHGIDIKWQDWKILASDASRAMTRVIECLNGNDPIYKGVFNSAEFVGTPLGSKSMLYNLDYDPQDG